MKLINESKGEVIAEDAELRVSVLGRALGLMFRKKPKPLVMLFRIPRRVSLHMFFVFFPIDVIFLNEDREVVDLKEDFKPWSTYKAGGKCRYVVELPKGVVEETDTTVGDKVSFEGFEEKYIN